ncbi:MULTISPECIES: YqaA family protein [Acidobacteriaceae]|uniref:YqaA family protein n=1 Tax=Acidobacteriaceae TaxID=204434 RepID=UPI00131C9FD8|nr:MULTISPECIES: VTT domain-containing protein [Acidobacteriaceae]MDW5267624.1 VTT domain-containing protein [Edaphobacter sp.]
MKIHPIALFHKLNTALLVLMKPLGAWGLGALAIVDTSSIPMPIDALMIDYVAHDHDKFLVYCLMAAVGSAIGSLVPYYFGRAGGELFLLKRINRHRYEALRDKFERQEFLAIMIPAMMPPPMPVKVIEFAAGVFEMKPLLYFGAIFAGKFVRFGLEGLITILYGPAILNTIGKAFHEHLGHVLGVIGVLVGLLVFYIVRKLFSKRRGTQLPAEDGSEE